MKSIRIDILGPKTTKKSSIQNLLKHVLKHHIYGLFVFHRTLSQQKMIKRSGLGIGAAISLLLRFLAWRRAARAQHKEALENARAAEADPERQRMKELHGPIGWYSTVMLIGLFNILY